MCSQSKHNPHTSFNLVDPSYIDESIICNGESILSVDESIICNGESILSVDESIICRLFITVLYNAFQTTIRGAYQLEPVSPPFNVTSLCTVHKAWHGTRLGSSEVVAILSNC